jgi:hypothetical protein
MIQLTTFTDFSISPWTNSPGAHESVFKLDKLRYDVVPLIDYLHATLYSLGKPFVYRTMFTLTNVTSGISMLSYGLNRAPVKQLRRMNGLHFTFAFTSRKWYNERVPRYILPMGTGVTFWGQTFRTSSDFMTIAVPHTVVRAMGIRTFNLRELNWLYHLVGALTKNFLFHNRFYVEDEDYNHSTITSTLTYAQLPSLFKHRPYDTWIYSHYAWRSMANVLNPRSVTEDFCQHYLKNLTQFFGRHKTNNVLAIENRLVEIIKAWVANNDPRIPPLPEGMLADDYVYYLLGAAR